MTRFTFYDDYGTRWDLEYSGDLDYGVRITRLWLARQEIDLSFVGSAFINAACAAIEDQLQLEWDEREIIAADVALMDAETL